jgi:hypothetical protein
VTRAVIAFPEGENFATRKCRLRGAMSATESMTGEENYAAPYMWRFAFLVQSLSLPAALQTIKIGMIEPLSGSFVLQGHEAAPKSHRVQCLK